jgi:hypothetical protein
MSYVLTVWLPKGDIGIFPKCIRWAGHLRFYRVLNVPFLAHEIPTLSTCKVVAFYTEQSRVISYYHHLLKLAIKNSVGVDTRKRQTNGAIVPSSSSVARWLQSAHRWTIAKGSTNICVLAFLPRPSSPYETALRFNLVYSNIRCPKTWSKFNGKNKWKSITLVWTHYYDPSGLTIWLITLVAGTAFLLHESLSGFLYEVRKYLHWLRRIASIDDWNSNTLDNDVHTVNWFTWTYP